MARYSPSGEAPVSDPVKSKYGTITCAAAISIQSFLNTLSEFAAELLQARKVLWIDFGTILIHCS